MHPSSEGLSFLYLHEEEGMQAMQSRSWNFAEAVLWHVRWFRFEHPVLALSLCMDTVVYDSYAYEIPNIVTRAWCAHQVLVQVTVVPVEWVTKVVSLV